MASNPVDELLFDLESLPEEWTPEAAVWFLRGRDTPEDHLCADVMEALIDEVKYLDNTLERLTG